MTRIRQSFLKQSFLNRVTSAGWLQIDDWYLAEIYDGRLLNVENRPIEEESFSQLSEQHRDYLRRVVRARMDVRLATRVDPSDLVQETLIEAMRRFRTQQAESPLPIKLWLRQIAVDRVKMAERRHLRSQKRGVFREMPFGPNSSAVVAAEILRREKEGERPESELKRKESIQEVQAALQSMTEQDREILMLRTFEGLDYQEIEKLTDVAAATARKRYGRALARLHKKLKHNDNPNG